MTQNFGREIVSSADLCYNGVNEKPSSGRKVARRSRDGRSPRDFRFISASLLCTLPQSPSVTAFGPGRKHSLLPALAKNMPLAYFLNASRPPGGSLWTRSCIFRGMGFALCLCNTNAKLAIKRNDK